MLERFPNIGGPVYGIDDSVTRQLQVAPGYWNE